jgi:hypothetical protein
LRIPGDRSLFAESIDRLTPWLPLEQIRIATSAELAEVLEVEAPHLPRENFRFEPEPKGTASVLGLAAVILQQQDPEAVMAVLTSDHAIRHPDRLRSLLLAGSEVASAGRLVTLGIPPETPDTGYGYIHRGAALGEFLGEKAFMADQVRGKAGRRDGSPISRQRRILLELGYVPLDTGAAAGRDRTLDAGPSPRVGRLRPRKRAGSDESWLERGRSLCPRRSTSASWSASDVAVLDAPGLGCPTSEAGIVFTSSCRGCL